jgi:hypothetical protein
MKELQRKQFVRRVMYSYPSLIILVLLTLLLAKGAWGIFMKERESARVVRELEEKVEQVEGREAELEAAIARIQTEDGLIEEIKGKFSVTRPGEHVAIVVDERLKPTTTEESGESWLSSVWQGIKGLWR